MERKYELSGARCRWNSATCTFSMQHPDAPLLDLQKTEAANVICMLRSTCTSHAVAPDSILGENVVAGFVHPETEQFFLVHKKCEHEYELVAHVKGAQGYIAFDLEPFSFSVTKQGDIFNMTFAFSGKMKVWTFICPVESVLPLRTIVGF